MKSRWPTIFVAFLVPLILVGVHFYDLRSCEGGAADGTAVWVPHLNMCAATASEGGDALVLDVDTICGSEEGDCQYIYRSPVTGEPLVLPDFVNVSFTPNSYPVTPSADLKWLVYVQLNEAEAQVHVYDLVNEQDYKVQSIDFEASYLSSFTWAEENRFSFVALNYNAADPENFTATRYLYEWHDETWSLVSMEPVEGGTVECNPIYCELLH